MEWLKQLWSNFQGNYWSRWTPVERATFSAVAAVIGVLFLGLLFVPMFKGSAGGYTQLASNLSVSDYNDVVSYLSRNGIDYQAMNNNTTVLVPQKDLYRARYDIGLGVVLSGGEQGYKIFEEPRLGITDQYFQEQKIHAKEVELERTLRAGTPMIENVFVHLNIPEKTLFKSDQGLPTATVKVIPRGRLESENVEAIQTVVAFAVDGLEPERVKVVDKNMRILEGAKALDPMKNMSDAQMDLTRQVEYELEQKAIAVLNPVVPRSNVKVTALLKFNRKDSTKTVYDPETVVRSERTETETTTETRPRGIPGTSSNVPGAAVESANESMTTRESEKTEVNNEVSSEVVTSQERGFTISRLSVAVLVDDTTQDQQALSTLVKNAVGFDPTRDGNENFFLASLPFDMSETLKMERQIQQRQQYDLLVAGIYGSIILVVFLGMFGGIYFIQKRRVRMHQHLMTQEMDFLKEKKAMTERRELSLDELGLVDVGDIASLSEEDQRRLKIRQKVEEFAKNQSEDFASILRSWLSQE